MSTKQHAEWYLVVEGKRVGPYSVAQFELQLKSGELKGEQRATSDRIGGEFTALSELVSAYDRAADKSSPEAGFHAPPRPEIDSTHVVDPNVAPNADATSSLFDTLLAAKERKAKFHAPPVPSAQSGWNMGVFVRPERKVPPQLIFIVALVAVLSVSVWALTKVLSSKPDASAPTAQSAPPEHAPLPATPGFAPPGSPGALPPPPPPPPPAQAGRPQMPPSPQRGNLKALGAQPGPNYAPNNIPPPQSATLPEPGPGNDPGAQPHDSERGEPQGQNHDNPPDNAPPGQPENAPPPAGVEARDGGGEPPPPAGDNR